MSLKSFVQPNASRSIMAALLVSAAVFSGHAALKNGTESEFWKKLKNGESPSFVVVGHSTSQAYPSPFCSSSKSFVPWPNTLKAELEKTGSFNLLSCTCAGNPVTAFMGDNDSYGTAGIDWLTSQQADAVIIEFAIGADCVGRFDITVAESKASHEQLIDAILAARSDTEIFLWTGARSYGGKWNDRSSRASSDESQPDYAAMYVELARERNVYVVDTYPTFMQIHDQEGLDAYKAYMADENHTNSKAAEEIIVPTILDAMKGEVAPSDRALTLLSPQDGAQFAVGDVMSITWDFNPDSITEGIEISLSTDGGASWLAINTSPIDKNAKQYDWTIPEELNGNSVLTANGAIGINEYNNEGGRVAASVKIIPPGVDPIIVDNTDPQVEVVGGWVSSTNATGFEGTDYLWDGGAPKTGKKVIYKPNIVLEGSYEIFAKWTAHDNRAKEAPYEINDISGVQTVTMDQERNGGTWMSLGVFNLAQSSDQPVVTINAEGTPSEAEIVVADAIKLVYMGPASVGVDRSARVAPAGAIGTVRRTVLLGSACRVSVPAGATGYTLYSPLGRVVAQRRLDSDRRSLSLSRDLFPLGVAYIRFSGAESR